MSTCQYRHCGQPVRQQPGGRARQYCNDGCRQGEHRARKAEAATVAARRLAQSWGDFQPATLDQLTGYIVAGSQETARKWATLVIAEQQASRAALVECGEYQARPAIVTTRHVTISG